MTISEITSILRGFYERIFRSIDKTEILSHLKKFKVYLSVEKLLPINFKFVAKGVTFNSVINTWIDIWTRDKRLGRKYSYDFEVFGEKSNNGDKSEVEIFISIK